LAGNASSLKEPGSSIIDKSSAIKYFGDWKNAMGQFLKLDNTALLKITGVVEDAPLNSDFPIPLFISYETFKQYPRNYNYSPEWGSLSSNHQIYILLPERLSATSIQSQMDGFVKKYYKEGNDSKEVSLKLQ